MRGGLRVRGGGVCDVPGERSHHPRTCFTDEAAASKRSKNAKYTDEKGRKNELFMVKLYSVFMVAGNDGDTLCELPGGWFDTKLLPGAC